MRASVLFLIAAVLLSVAFAGLGYFVRGGLTEFRTGDRFVTVRGLAERDVRADMAVWTLPVTATANDLVEAQTAIENAAAKTIAFLKGQGFDADEITINRTEVIDLLAQEYRPNEGTNLRYIIRQFITVHTEKVDLVISVQGSIGELFKQGIVIAAMPGGQPQARYIYKGLNSVKPDMIAEATRNARESADQFARDSNARLGGIKTASQGQFQILPADAEFQYDESQAPNKKLRVVTTVTYSLF